MQLRKPVNVWVSIPTEQRNLPQHSLGNAEIEGVHPHQIPEFHLNSSKVENLEEEVHSKWGMGFPCLDTHWTVTVQILKEDDQAELRLNLS